MSSYDGKKECSRQANLNFEVSSASPYQGNQYESLFPCAPVLNGRYIQEKSDNLRSLECMKNLDSYSYKT